MERLEQLIETFEFLPGWEERYAAIISLGRKLEPFPETDRTDANKVRGCVSQVWLTCTWDSSTPPRRAVLRADSDAHIVKGLVAVLLLLYHQKTAEEILAIDAEDCFQRLGFDTHLSPQRSNGLYAMVSVIRQQAQRAQVGA